MLGQAVWNAVLRGAMLCNLVTCNAMLGYVALAIIGSVMLCYAMQGYAGMLDPKCWSECLFALFGGVLSRNKDPTLKMLIRGRERRALLHPKHIILWRAA